MKRILSILALFTIISISTSQAQVLRRLDNNSVAQTEAKHFWHQGKLTWNDFQNRATIDEKHSHLEFFIGYTQGHTKENHVNYNFPEVYAYVSPMLSWADPAYRTPQLLQYNQIIFDLIEAYRRNLQTAIFQTWSGFEDEQLLDNTMRQIGEEISRITIDTKEGSDSLEMAKWDSIVQQMLLSNPPLSLPSINENTLKMGVYFDLASTIPSGNLSNFFGPGLGAGFGFYLGWGKHQMLMDFLITGTNIKNNFTYDEGDYFQGEHGNTLDFLFGYGYSIIENNRHRLTPFLAFGAFGYTFGDGDGSTGPMCGSWQFGATYERHLTSYSTILPHFNDWGRISMHSRLFVAYNKMNSMSGPIIDATGVPSGLSINLQIGFSFSGNAIAFHDIF